MFQGTAAQFLAILEALSETQRRTLHCEAPVPDAEDTAVDVCSELFFAGMEVVAGGGGMRHTHALRHDSDINPFVWELRHSSLMELVAKGDLQCLAALTARKTKIGRVHEIFLESKECQVKVLLSSLFCTTLNKKQTASHKSTLHWLFTL